MNPILTEIAMFGRYVYTWEAPYATGRLATQGLERDVGVFGMPPGAVGFSLFAKGKEYGTVLNEAETIHWRIVNRHTGKVHEGSYANRHYRFLDRIAESIAEKIPVTFPGVRRVQ